MQKDNLKHENPNDENNVLCADFLISKGFSKAVRWFDYRWEQFRVYYKIDGYDCDILLSPCPQTVPNYFTENGDLYWMPPEHQVDDFSEIEILENHITEDWHVYINSVDNHLTTLNECSELIDLMRVCRCPLIGT
jgi:hypothetical protein